MAEPANARTQWDFTQHVIVERDPKLGTIEVGALNIGHDVRTDHRV